MSPTDIYSPILYCSFEALVEGSVPSPSLINPLIRQFRQELQAIKIDDGVISASVSDLTDFKHEVRGHRVIACLTVHWNVYSKQLIQFIIPRLAGELKRCSFELPGEPKHSVKVLDVVSGYDCRDRELWPQEKF